MTSNTPSSPQKSSATASHFTQTWSDPVAGVHALSGAITTVPLYGDGHRLVVADEDRQLKVWNGHVKESEHVLLDPPTAVEGFFAPQQDEARLAVAAGPQLYIYVGVKIHKKIALPFEQIHGEDEAAWATAGAASPGTQRAEALTHALRQAQARGAALCARSRALLAADDAVTAAAHVDAWAGVPLADTPYATCMTGARVSATSKQPTTVFVGDEAGGITLLDSASLTISQTWTLDGVPSCLAAHGSIQGGYTLFVAVREPFVRVLRDGALLAQRLALSADAVAIATCGTTLYVAQTDSALALYDVGTLSRRCSLALPAAPVALAALLHPQAPLAAVALRDCAVIVYSGAVPVSRHETAARVLGLHGGPFMNDYTALVATLEGGALDVRVLPRRAKLRDIGAAHAAPAPPPLAVPKKTKLYVEFAKRERENAHALYHVFQQDLLKLRLRTAEAYVKVLLGDLAAADAAGDPQLSLTAAVVGLGPDFQAVLKVTNRSAQPARGLVLALSAPAGLYALQRTALPLPVLLPAREYPVRVRVRCTAPEAGAAGELTAALLRAAGGGALVTRRAGIPVSEVDDEAF